MLINSRESLGHFLDNKKLDISDDTLSYCGLNNENENFDLGEHLLKCFHEFHQHKENKQQTAK